MARKVIESGLGDLEELWGLEVTVYYPDLYAGATDVAGIYAGKESIVDFKQTNKPKRREWIGDYFLQLGAYAMAHNYVYGTKINQGSHPNVFERWLFPEIYLRRTRICHIST